MAIDFDDIWQKYSKVSRIEYACFSFHVRISHELNLITSIQHTKYQCPQGMVGAT